MSKIQTQYGANEWQDINSAPIHRTMWIAAAAQTNRMTVGAVAAALKAGQIMPVKAEWHDRIREVEA